MAKLNLYRELKVRYTLSLAQVHHLVPVQTRQVLNLWASGLTCFTLDLPFFGSS